MKENEYGLYYSPKENSFKRKEEVLQKIESEAEIMFKLSKQELPNAVENKLRFEKHLYFCDFQIPDHNQVAVDILRNKFIPDFKADHIHMVGDMVNFSRAGKYTLPVGYRVSLGDEIKMAREIIFGLADKAREANPNCKIKWYQGNHEMRLEKYLARNAEALGDIEDENGDLVMTVPALMNLKEHGIEWIPYYESQMVGNVEIEHGDVARIKAGYTAHAMLDKRGRSGVSGHTHRLAFITRNQGGDEKFWIEAGSLCNSNPNPNFVKKPDWTNGFAVGIFDKANKVLHPIPVMFQNNRFVFNNKLYE